MKEWKLIDGSDSSDQETVPDDQESLPEITPINKRRKTFCYISKDVQNENEDLNGELSRSFKQIASHRPADKTIDPSPGGRPGMIITPGGSRLTRHVDYGSILIFSNETPKTTISPKLQPLSERDANYINSRLVPPLTEDIKEYTAQISSSSLEECKHKRRLNGSKRSIPQDRAVAQSGTISAKYAALTQEDWPVLEDDKFEWLHLVAFQLIGDKGQVAENLVSGLRQGNEYMTKLEANVAKMIESLETATITVKATLMPGTHLAKKIDYKITSSQGRVYRFTIDPLNRIKPTTEVGQYLSIFTDALIVHANKQLAKKQMSASSSASSSSSSLFVQQVLDTSSVDHILSR